MLTKSLSTTPTAAEIERFMPIVHQVVSGLIRRLPPSVQRDDLQSAAVCGLIDGLRRNNGTTGAAFEAYVRIRVRGAVMDELRRQDFVPRHQRAHGDAPHVVRMDDLSPDGEAFDFADGAADAASLYEEKQDATALESAIATLPERERLIVRMRYFEAKTVREIATELSISDPRVSQLHTRALVLLRGAMDSTRG